MAVTAAHEGLARDVRAGDGGEVTADGPAVAPESVLRVMESVLTGTLRALTVPEGGGESSLAAGGRRLPVPSDLPACGPTVLAAARGAAAAAEAETAVTADAVTSSSASVVPLVYPYPWSMSVRSIWFVPTLLPRRTGPCPAGGAVS